MKHWSDYSQGELLTLVSRIQDALGTAEWGDDLVEVARNAHKAEQELATVQDRQKPGQW